MSTASKAAARLDLTKIVQHVAPPERTVTVSLAGSAVSQLAEVDQLLETAKGKDKADLLARRDALQQEILGNRVKFRLRGVTPFVRAAAFEAYPQANESEAEAVSGAHMRVTHMVAALVIAFTAPDGTVTEGPLHMDDVLALRETMGEGQFEELTDAIQHAGDRDVRDVLNSPFWREASSTIPTS